MLGCDYEIIYKKVKENVVVTALSRQYKEEGSLLALFLHVLEWLEEARQGWLTNDMVLQLIQSVQEDPNPPEVYTWQRDTLRYKGRIVLVKNYLKRTGLKGVAFITNKKSLSLS